VFPFLQRLKSDMQTPFTAPNKDLASFKFMVVKLMPQVFVPE